MVAVLDLCKMQAAILIAFTHLACARELKYPDGVKPGDQVSGAEGEFFRYKHVFVKPPDDEDRVSSLKMTEDMRCKACEVMVESLLKRAESLSQDHIMDQFDGELESPVEFTNDPQENRVNKNRKGCNKHFKDELLLKGWAVRSCPDGATRTWCLEKSPEIPTERDVDTYSTRNDAVFYACEHTLGRYGQELAEYIAERMEDGAPLHEVISTACRDAARCEGVKPKKKTKKKKKEAKKEKKKPEKVEEEL